MKSIAIYSFYFAVIASLSCCKEPHQEKNAPEVNDNTIKIEYSNLINRCQVKAIWKPMKIDRDYAIGPSIVEFTDIKNGSKYHVTFDYYSVMKDRLKISYNEDSTVVLGFLDKNLVLEYISEKEFGATDEPFFFYDVDFDNKKELVFIENYVAQRSTPYYYIYKFQEEESEDDWAIYLMGRHSTELYEMQGAPFPVIDGLTEFDPINKKIIVRHSCGWCSCGYDEYKLNTNKSKSENKFILDLMTRYELDETSQICYEFIYQVINNNPDSLVLISKKEKEQ